MKTNTARAKILRVLETAPEGLTCKQIERMTGIRHATASAALSGMAEAGKVHRLDGFRKPYHWITPSHLRGRLILPKRTSLKDQRILSLEMELMTLQAQQARVDYPTGTL